MPSEQQEALVKQEKELFDKSDKDKDGKLSMAEVKDMLYPDLKEHNFSGMQAATLMEMVDADKDKALSVEEMNKQHEKTVAFLRYICRCKDVSVQFREAQVLCTMVQPCAMAVQCCRGQLIAPRL